MHENPLIHPIFEVLKSEPQGVSEYALIRRLIKKDHVINDDAIKDNLGLFKTHFLVMNALYQLQHQLLSKQRYLFISAQLIQLTAASETSKNNSLTQDCDARTRSYYLDWKNLTDTTGSDVARLLNDFWSRYHALNERSECLAELGLTEDEDWQDIQQKYRRLARSTHPDKGGDADRFIAIHRAYRTLARIHRQ